MPATINLPGPGPAVPFTPTQAAVTTPPDITPPLPVVVDTAVDRAANY